MRLMTLNERRSLRREKGPSIIGCSGGVAPGAGRRPSARLSLSTFAVPSAFHFNFSLSQDVLSLSSSCFDVRRFLSSDYSCRSIEETD